MSKRLLFTLAAAVLAACSAGGPAGPDGGSPDQSGAHAPVPVTRLAPGPYSFTYSSGYHEPARLVVRSEAEWRRVWGKLHERVHPQPELRRVDFSRHAVLVAALGSRSSGGYSILVDSVSDAGGELRAVVRKVSPGAGCVVTQAFTQPVDVVLVPASGKRVRFVERDEVLDCR
ncbi:MAG TPA: protease complex subunit PrcB family protein [Longimicrobiaceae bacterium]|nr:protease complex subunit PrcB family protein [Longimicrobiaceae bacterium]